MTRLVVYGVGSPILGDVEESAYRAGITIVLGVRNVAEPSRLSSEIPTCAPEEVPEELRDLPFLVPLFTPGHRQWVVGEALSRGFVRHATLIDPTVIQPRDLELGEGSYVNAGSVFGSGSRFGAYAFVNRSASIGHHVDVGRYVSIGPGATLAGGVRLGDGVVVGAGAVVLPGIAVGANAVIGAGAVVTRNVGPECLALGNPARVVRQDIGGHKGVRVR
ncbi:2,3,4,5-tetrahydropyridine-2,6-dicarboxylate N-acetyltransferase [Methylobacterium cerastii]|uniref:2,3,4,5-tetrahydropyridine-2,6-dicarboxylate N-acetyltransferase n=1 Tax=Methylobacterium cerastii TaxID=932741 RepID=A0ABQ4QG28_9HYPH|nr:DapH/DapD/GlmU-related protein [Methylobacterium cerastii]GJD44206.1 2,3,4,5-tetrahydropyridine-2,6-dicarboxylate N-acetyltransferase [Methylobacterium cerastii]